MELAEARVALEAMCTRCINHEQCLGTGCQPKNELKKTIEEADIYKKAEVYKKALKLACDMLTQHCCKDYECNIDCSAATDIPLSECSALSDIPLQCGKVNWEETLLRKAREEE